MIRCALFASLAKRERTKFSLPSYDVNAVLIFLPAVNNLYHAKSQGNLDLHYGVSMSLRHELEVGKRASQYCRARHNGHA